ncbi:MAG: DUF4038 domain-containing protein, partial [bacterium]|nr:DUF4038 domain-containing protein [bacterium]
MRISADQRHFEYADSTPFFFLGDTNWAINTVRCGLGDTGDGPFFRYLADRRAKGFTAILMSFMRGFGDTVNEPAGQRNEGGYPFAEADVERHQRPGFGDVGDPDAARGAVPIRARGSGRRKRCLPRIVGGDCHVVELP